MLQSPLGALRWATLAFAILGGVAQDWPRFRGPGGRGHGGSVALPDSPTRETFNWRVGLPGGGNSSPVVWGARVFVTCYDADGSRCLLVCLATEDGSTLWTRSLGIQSYGMHDLNSYASVTPAVDSTTVVMAWTSGKMLMSAAFDHDGKKLWQLPLGRSTADHGGGSSPTLFDGVALIANLTEGRSDSFLTGLDARTGEVLWKHPRATSRASFATPLVYAPDEGPPEAIFSSTSHGLTGIAPRTGKLIWEQADLFKPRCVASPALGGQILFATAGSGGGGKVGVALNLARRTEAGVPERQYVLRQGLPYVPSPLATSERLYLWSDGGIVSCLNLESGEEIWRERVGGTFYGSPILADGKLFAISMSGELVWVRESDEFELLGRLDLEEASNSTPAVARGILYLRTETHLISMGQAAPPSGD